MLTDPRRCSSINSSPQPRYSNSTGYRINGTGSVQLGARLLGSNDAAMAMIDAYDPTTKAPNKSGPWTDRDVNQ